MGEGISEESDEELQENNNPTNYLNDLEDQPVGNDIEEEEHTTDEENPTTYTTTGEATLTAAERNYYLLLVNCLKKMNLAVLAQVLEVELTTQMS